jgi:hypothetical protein
MVERLPLYRWGRTPERLLQLSTLALALLVGIALSSLGRRRSSLALHITFLLGGLILAETMIIFPFPAPVVQVPGPVRLMAKDEMLYAVADIPIAKRQVSNYAMLYQTYHEHPIIGGYIHRNPPGTRAWSKAFDALFDSVADASASLTPLEGQALLGGLGLRRVVVHRHFVSARNVQSMVQLLSRWLGPPTYSDAHIVLFGVPSSDELTERNLSGSRVQFGEQLVLDGIDVRRAGARLDVVLTWRAVALPYADYVVVLDLLGKDGRRWVSLREAPLSGRWSTRLWSPGEILVDTHSVSVPADLPVGRYDLALGMIEAQASQPLIVSAEGLAVSQNRVVFTDAYSVP